MWNDYDKMAAHTGCPEPSLKRCPIVARMMQPVVRNYRRVHPVCRTRSIRLDNKGLGQRQPRERLKTTAPGFAHHGGGSGALLLHEDIL
ncbi:hypothetical protein ATB93_11670 [Sphingomonas sp. WG]|nr:hypothetical protein ATB93_11670 [Sphingomonas sp. WG]